MLLLFYALGTICKTIAILANTSKNFFNYRHMSNIRAMDFLLKQAGLPPENILILHREDPWIDPRNVSKQINKNKIFLTENITIDYFPIETSPMSEQFILNVLHLRHPALCQLGSGDNIIFYMCGHAREGFFKVSDRYFIFKNDLMKGILTLARRVSRLLIILDTCQAASLVDHDKLPSNTCVVCTSLHDQFSYSCFPISFLGVPGIDEVVLAAYQKGIDVNLTVGEYFESLNGSDIRSTVICLGNGKLGFEEFLRDKGGMNGTEEFIIE